MLFVASVDADGEATFCGVAEIAGDVCGEAVGAGVVVVGTPCVSSTDRVPKSGSDKVNARRKNAVAAPIVIFDNSVAVPRGPNAVLETELVNNAPASALPGCNKIEMIKTMHDSANSMYKK